MYHPYPPANQVREYANDAAAGNQHQALYSHEFTISDMDFTTLTQMYLSCSASKGNRNLSENTCFSVRHFLFKTLHCTLFVLGIPNVGFNDRDAWEYSSSEDHACPKIERSW